MAFVRIVAGISLSLAVVTLIVASTLSSQPQWEEYSLLEDAVPLVGHIENDDYGFHFTSNDPSPIVGQVDPYSTTYGYRSVEPHVRTGVNNPLVGSVASSSSFLNDDEENSVHYANSIAVPQTGNLNAPRDRFTASAEIGVDAVPQLGHVRDTQPWWYEKYGTDSLSTALSERDGDWWYKAYGPSSPQRYGKKLANGKDSRHAPAQWLLSLGGNDKYMKPNHGPKATNGQTPQERLRHWFDEEMLGQKQ